MNQLKQRLRQLRWSTFLGGALVLVFFIAAGIVFWRDGRALSEQIDHLDYRLLLLSFLIEIVGWLIAVPIWQQIVARFDSRVRLRDHFRIYTYSMLGIVVPGRLWGLVGRTVLYERKGIASFQIAVASVIEYLLIGLSGLLVFGLTTSFSGVENLWQRPIVAVICIFVTLLLVQPFLFNRMALWVLKRSRQVDTLPNPTRYRDLALWLLVESIVVVIGGTAVFVLFASLYTPSPQLYLLTITAWAAAAIAGNLFFWIPGPVLRDGLMIALLASALPDSLALLLVLIVRVWTIGSILILVGLVWTISNAGKIRFFRNNPSKYSPPP
jgi:uncharacterized membrane protein YbhN (UPF0104 family)